MASKMAAIVNQLNSFVILKKVLEIPKCVDLNKQQVKGTVVGC